MIIGKEYKIIQRDKNWCPVAQKVREYTVAFVKTKEEAVAKIKELEENDKTHIFLTEEKLIETSPYGDWRDIYG